ncbi:MAG: hypothetical protein AAGI48_13340 [Verrucomicrobiota bacterium]
MKPKDQSGGEWARWFKDVGRWAARRSLKKGKLKCQRCGRVRHEGIPEQGEVLTCVECGWFGTLSDWWKSDAPGEVVSRDVGEAPPDTGIRLEDGSNRTVIRIPASGSGGGLIGFGWVWTVFSSLMLIFFLVSADGWEGVGAAAFLLIFVSVGVGLLYAGYRMKHASHELSIDAGHIELTREWRGRRKTKRMRRRDFESVKRQVFYTKNYDPVYGIELRGKSGKLRFGSSLRDEEKLWLVTELRKRLDPEDEAAAGRPADGDRGRSFAIPIPGNSSVAGAWIILLLMGGVFLGVSIFAMDEVRFDGDSDAPFPFSLIEGFFGILGPIMRVVFGLVGLGMLVGGVVVLIQALKRHGAIRELVGTEEALVVLEKRNGRILKQQSFDRRAYRGFRIASSGHVNNRPHVRLRLFVGDEVASLASWVDEEKARDFVEQAERHLGRPEDSRAEDVDHPGGGG